MRDSYRQRSPGSRLVGCLLDGLDAAVQELRATVGDTADENGARHSLVVMVANDGVLELVLNIACSLRAANLSSARVVVYVQSAGSVALVRAMGLASVCSPGLGTIPDSAANITAIRPSMR